MANAISPILQTLQENLNRAKSSSPDGQLRLDINTMGSGTDLIVQFFQQTLFQNYLTLKGEIGIVPQLEGNQLVVTGTATEALYDVENMGLVCTFGVSNDSTLTLNVKMTPPAVPKWAFTTSFYELENTFFENLSYTSPIFILSTYDYYDSSLNINVKTGASLHIQPIRFDGSLTPALSLIDSALAQPLPPLYGSLREDSNSRQLDLKMSFPNIRLEVADIFPIVMSDPMLVLSNRHSVVPEHTITTISVQSDVQVGRVTLPLVIQLPSPSSRWQLGLIPGESVPLSSIPDFLGSITGINLLSTLPDRIIAIQGFYINAFSVAFDLDKKQFWSLDLGISSKDTSGTRSSSTSWTIIPELLEIKDLSFRLWINRVIQQDGKLRTDVTGTIAGTFEIASSFNVLAQISLPLSSALWTLQTSPNLKLSLSQLTKYVGGVDLASLLPGNLGTIGDFTLLKSILSIDPTVPTVSKFSFTLFSTNDWIIISERLIIKNIIIDLSINKPLSEREVTGYVGGTIGIGTVDVEVEVSRYAVPGDWLMTIKSARIPLPSLQDLVSLVDADLTSYLPDTLASSSFFISDFNIDLDLSKKTITRLSFILLAESEWKYYLSQKEQSKFIAFFEVSAAIVKTQTELIGVIVAYFEIAGVTLEMLAEYLDPGWNFSGSTGRGQEIHIGTLIEDLAKKFETDQDFPRAIADLIIENIGVSFKTTTKDFSFTCEGKFPINNQEVDITVNINIIQQLDGSYKKHFDGHITIGSLKFALIFDTDQNSTKFLAAYHDDQTIKIKDLIGYIDSQLKDDIPIPEGLEISLKDALFAYSKQQTLTNFLLGLNIGGGINLSNLPLVGREFPPNETVKFSLQVLVTKYDFIATELQKFNTLYTDGGIQLPTTNINQRLNLTPSIQFGSEILQLQLPITINEQTGQIQDSPSSSNNTSSLVTPSATPTTIDDGTKWFQLQKAFGPVHFQRVGIKYQDSKIWVLLDASLNLAGLSLSLDGLSVNSPLSKFDPHFDLKGIGIDYKGSDTLEIGGAFLRTQVTKDGKTYEEYDGAAVIKFNVKAKALTLSAIGSYAYFDEHPSLFIYALLDYPIGGPSFFFVTGLAAGFGYNRALKVPTIDQIATFPLVAEAVNPPPAEGSNLDQATRLTGELTKLRDYIPPETGQIFLAIGIKFTSFKLIDSFLLLTVAFGNRFELNILGLATLIAPPNVGAGIPPVAEVQLALKASFLPAEGFIGIIAQLTPNSYILSQACHLTGGFAFYGWFAPNIHEGDFVLTLGGYHPLFKVPDHYPKVPRLGLNWQVSPELYLKADAYFALTPSAIMAGGHLQATWNSGPLSAWFNAGADFLMSWKPYHYDISIYVDMGVSYTFHFFGTHHITVQLGADLHIWGPEFTGIAHIHLWIISFDVSFGSSGSQAPISIDWNEFKTSFLPADDAICTITVQEGLVRKINQDDKTDLGIINPKDFCLVTNSVIPAKNAVYKFVDENHKEIITAIKELENIEINTQFGIGSMAVTSDKLTSTLTITITRDGQPLSLKEFEEEFTCSSLTKKVPAGLWGESSTSNLNGNQFIENTLSGLEIKPKKQPEPGATQAINRSELQFSPTSINNAYHWQTISTFQEEKTKDIRNTVVDNTVKNTRDNLLKALNLNSEEIDLSETIADHFLGSPKIGVLVN